MLKGLLAVSGHSGLFRLVAESKNNIIVESLDSNKRMPVYSVSKVSSLEDISVYTETDETPLKEILKAISDKENGNASIDSKSPDNNLKAYFESIVPNYDKSRVYVSDIKKILLWYNTLQSKNMLDFSEDNKKESE